MNVRGYAQLLLISIDANNKLSKGIDGMIVGRAQIVFPFFLRVLNDLLGHNEGPVTEGEAKQSIYG